MITKAHIRRLAAASGTTAGVLLIAACGGQATPAPPKTPSGRSATVGLERDGTLGKVLVDSRGRTLYAFDKDVSARSACDSACAAAWPPLRASAEPVAGAGLTASKLSTTPRPDGRPQVVYNGHPLYLYTGDGKAGETNGQGVAAFGAPWYALSGAGEVVTRKVSHPSGGSPY